MAMGLAMVTELLGPQVPVLQEVSSTPGTRGGQGSTLGAQVPQSHTNHGHPRCHPGSPRCNAWRTMPRLAG
ncbi:hypothetical protein E2562_004120 [Oryza meyeriana var. granulata]|uniref:Uncharacterized protein n=1 Tax=Oryza meyeriana var. granulata TaxID=110450 RepID=A0A6G1EV01_9ORYZ|nr:hypothetical protein E2562_004120 [Oryza meyeriana var. granulata]